MFGPAPQNSNPPTFLGLQWCNFPTPSSPSLSSFLFLFVGWCVCLAKGLSPLFPSLSPSSSSFLFPFVGWCVHVPEGLVSPCLPLLPFLFPLVGWCVRLLVSLCWMVCPFSRALGSLLGSLCWMVCSRGLVSPFLPASLASQFPLLDGVSAFPRLCLPSPSSPSLSSLFLFVGWCVRLPEGLSPLSSACLLSCFALFDGVSAFLRSSLPSCFSLLDGVSTFPRPCFPSPNLSPNLSRLSPSLCQICS